MPDTDDFRITSPVEILALLRRLQQEHALVTLSAPNGNAYTTVLWGLDPQRQTLNFSAEESDPRLLAVLNGNEVTAVAYLDSIKVQFDLDGMVRVHSGSHCALHARLPTTMFRFQRRAAFRVQPLVSTSPMARLPQPGGHRQPLALRVLDVSLQGVALLLPDGVPDIAAGTRIESVDLELDDETRLTCDLLVHHVTAIGVGSDAPRRRLGCELIGLDPRDRTLALYVNQTQKRRLATLGSIKD